MKRKTRFSMILAGVMATLVFAGMVFLKVPVASGYLHLGDAAVGVVASLVPQPFAFLAAAVGGALADVLGGYAQYFVFTALIKGAMTLCYTSVGETMLCRRNRWAVLAGIGITAIGYDIAEFVLLWLGGSVPIDAFSTALITVPGNLLQGAANAVLYLLIAGAMDKTGFRSRLAKWNK